MRRPVDVTVTSATNRMPAVSAAVHELLTTPAAVRDLIQDIAANAVVCLGMTTLIDRVFYGR